MSFKWLMENPQKERYHTNEIVMVGKKKEE